MSLFRDDQWKGSLTDQSGKPTSGRITSELTNDSMSFILTNQVDLHKLRSKHEYKSSAVVG